MSVIPNQGQTSRVLPRNEYGSLAAVVQPGSRPVVYVDGDGCEICASCARGSDNDKCVLRPRCWYIHYNGPSVICAGCGKAIESVYGGRQ